MKTRFTRDEAYSALLVGDDANGLDHSLITEVTGHGAVVIVVGDSSARPWRDYGVAALLPEDFDRDDLVGLLSEHAASDSRSRRRDPEERARLTRRMAGPLHSRHQYQRIRGFVAGYGLGADVCRRGVKSRSGIAR